MKDLAFFFSQYHIGKSESALTHSAAYKPYLEINGKVGKGNKKNHHSRIHVAFERVFLVSQAKCGYWTYTFKLNENSSACL